MASSKLIFTLAIVAIFAIVLPNTVEAQGDCPTVCPAVFSPVCATLNNGKKMQFSNSCQKNVAVCQKKINVRSSTPGEC